ncbi:hypothetical protein Bbelb_314440 [Branchiostoma belcheri]|nr:hypothetical protein Bbelb_314440 [Branchiostoma belcheri]
MYSQAIARASHNVTATIFKPKIRAIVGRSQNRPIFRRLTNTAEARRQCDGGIKVRYKEHCRPSANGYSSAIFHHLQHNQGHSFKLESTDVLDRETRWWERGVKEAIYERMYNPTLNREGGLRVDLSGTWDLALPDPRTDNT